MECQPCLRFLHSLCDCLMLAIVAVNSASDLSLYIENLYIYTHIYIYEKIFYV